MSIRKCIESIYSEVGHNVMSECIMRYGLDREECESWMSELIAGLSSGASSSSEKVSKGKGKGKVKGKGKTTEAVEASVEATESVVSTVEVVASYPFPIPFNKNRINDNGCHGLAYNHGLFNQCSKKKLDTGNYCKNCQKESDQSGQPSCGTIEARLSEDLLEYTDPKGRKPIAYLKVLEKQKFSVDTVKEFIMRENIEVEAIHFECNEQKRGRPKSKIVKQVEAATVEDLFATLVNDDTVSLADTEIMTDSEDEGESAEAVAAEAAEAVRVEAVRAAAEAKKSELAAEKEARVSMRCEETEQKKCEKEAKLQQLAAEKEAKLQQLAAEKEAKLQQLAAEKEAKAQQLAAEKEAKQKEKEAKLQQVAAEKEAKAKQVAAEKEAKAKQVAAEKEAKLKQVAAEKEAKADKLGKAPRKQAVKETIVKAPKVEEEEEPTVHVSVKSITINGTVYFKTKENVLYNPETKEAVGIYDEATNSIKELPEESDDELCEDEYDSDN
jgi:hypothetical protein